MRGPPAQDVNSAVLPVEEVTTTRSYPRLGDFGLLWKFLKTDSKDNAESSSRTILPDANEYTHKPAQADTIVQRPCLNRSSHSNTSFGRSQSASEKTPLSSPSKPENSNDAVLGYSPGPSNQSQALTVLERAASPSGGTQNRDSTTPRFPQPSLRPGIDASNPVDTPEATAKAKAGGKQKPRHKNGVAPLEISTDAESDSDTIIFDRTATQTPEGFVFVPSQAGTTDTRVGHYATSPSSYGENSSLDDDAFKNVITTAAGIQVLPAAYKTRTERRIGLMTKLLKEYPGFTQFASRVGCLAPKKIGVEHRPIHVFVDMSNVCFSVFQLRISA